MVCLKKDILVVLRTGFLLLDRPTSTGSKTFSVVVSPVEYTRKQKAVNPKKPNCGISAATIGEYVEHDRVTERQI